MPTLNTQNDPGQSLTPLNQGDPVRGIREPFNQVVQGLEQILRGTAQPSQDPSQIVPAVAQIYKAIEHTSGGDSEIDVQALLDDGTFGATETVAKANGYSVTSGAYGMIVETQQKTPVFVPVIPEKYLYFQQGSDSAGDPYDFPEDGVDWFQTHIRHHDYYVTEVYIWNTSGSYTVQLKIDGGLVGDEVTNATSYPYTFDPPIAYDKEDPITLHVTSGQDVAGFEAVYTLVER